MSFQGERVVSFESRRATEMATLVARNDGVAVVAPAVREVAVQTNDAARGFVAALEAGNVEVLVHMTGVGVRALVAEIEAFCDKQRYVGLLGGARIVVRGPKPAHALREVGVTRFEQVGAPNTWREVDAALATLAEGTRVFVVEHGVASEDLYASLRARGAVVTAIPVYRWALPEDTAPLRSALHLIASGGARIALFTSRIQVEHAASIAADEGVLDAVRSTLRAGVVASIGPVCTEALRAEGLEPDVEPENAKMGQLVKVAADRAAEILRAKGS